MLKKTCLLGVIVVLLASAGFSESTKSDQIKVIRSQVDEAIAELKPVTNDVTIGPFRREGVCRAGQLLQSHLENTSLKRADPELAAKAHRVMTAVYVAAFTLPFSRGDCIFNLVVGDVLTKAARQLEVSLHLYPEQPEAAQAREIIQEIDKGEDPTPDQLTKYLKFFTENIGARVSW